METGELRRRAGKGRPSSERPGRTDVGQRERRAAAPARPLGWPTLLLLVAEFLALFAVVYHVELRLPAPGALEANARVYLRRLVALGPRVCGSEANEQKAVQVILEDLTAIKKNVRSHHQLVIDHQVVSGSFKLQSLDGITSEYANVQNVVARLGPTAESNHSLLVNCHFDTAIGSPGASDDGISCAVMMEVMRRISQSRNKLRHNIIFLFNGAEENLLQGAHGFITQHRWAWSVRAHVNLEACGAGGREMVFQTGPGHPWLVKAYAESVPYPFAQIIGQEVFQSGIIPSDTDFRIFRDYGHIPGLDTAFIRNGYVYHTPFDDERQITPGSVQRAGENLQAVLLRLTTTDDMVDAEKQEVGTLVFMDYLGLFMLTYWGWVSDVACCLLGLVTILTVIRSIRSNGLTATQLASAVGVQLFSWALSFAVSGVIALGLDSWNATMSWYASHEWVVALYVAPTLGTLITVQQGMASWLMGKEAYVPRRLETLLYEAQRIILLVIMTALSFCGIYSTVLALVCLLFPTVLRSVLAEMVCGTVSGSAHLVTYVISQVPALSMLMYFAVTTTELFIPITGRAGNLFNPDLAIGLLTAALTVACSMFVMTTVSLVRSHRRLSRLLLLVGLVSFTLVALTPAGFPYSSQRPHIRAQRVWVQHIERTFRDRTGEVRFHDTGYLLMNLDRNSPNSLLSALPELANASRSSDDCERELYCGIPFYYPIRRGVYDNHVFAGPPPHILVPLVYSTTLEKRPDGMRRIHFNITGPDHMTMQLSPRPGVQLLRWNLADDRPLTGPQFQGRPSYFIYFSWCKTSAPWTFWADLQVTSSHEADDYLLDGVVNGHHIHGSGRAGPPLQALLARLPDWTVSMGFTSQLEAFRV